MGTPVNKGHLLDWLDTCSLSLLHMSSQSPAHPEPHVSNCQKRRAIFLLQVLDHYDVQGVAESMGITDRRFVTRLQQDLRLYASIAEAPRSGRPVLYTTSCCSRPRSTCCRG